MSQPVRQVNFAQTLLGLAEGSKNPAVDGFGDRQRVAAVEGLPAKRKQLAWPESGGHIQHQQKPIASARAGKDEPKLIPTQNLLVLRSEILGNLQLPARILHQELLLDGFIKDRSQVRAGLFDPVLVVPIRELIDMRLKHESVDGFESKIPKLLDQIDLNLSLLFLGCLGSPVSLSKRKITIPNEPLEGSGTVF